MAVVQAKHQKKPVKKTATRSRAKAAPVEPNIWQRHQRDLLIIGFVVVGLFVALADLHALGPVGHAISRALSDVLGVGRYALAVILLALGIALLWGKVELDRARAGWAVVLGLVAVSGLADVAGGRPGVHATTSVLGHAGGWLGVLTGGELASGTGDAGAIIILLALFVVAMMIATAIGLRTLFVGCGVVLRAIGRTLASWWVARPQREDEEDEDVDDTEPEPAPRRRVRAVVEPEPEDEEPDDDEEEEDEYEDESDVEEEFVYDEYDAEEDEPAKTPRPVYVRAPSNWELPPLTLLQRTRDQKLDRALTEAAGAELVSSLGAHGVETTLVGYTVGPSVTRFELELGPGVKVSRVTSLNKDIAYAMASPDVRILAPIPGRSAIGVEVPNRQRSLVALGDLLNSEESLLALHPLDVPIGRDIAGRTVVVNLGEMPHVLISGATGAGKSSAMNSLITALVMRATPDQLRLLLIDPKRVEMSQYNDLPHLLAPVVVDPKKAAGALHWAVKEMERRYDILAECGARDITSYQQMMARGELSTEPSNEELVAEAFERATGLPSDVEPAPGPEDLPYVVIVVDELNDLMMVAARDVEESVVRIAQMARAVGIHLVLATQRPSVDVITGVIKANVPSRMAFAVSSLADSRVILDQAGAERLIGKGDMLLVTASSNIARRLQSPWVSEEEVRRVVEAWRAQGGRRETVVALDEVSSRGQSSSGGGSGDDDDEILRKARDLVISTQTGSTSMLQRKLRVGFARAGRIMDQLEEERIVAPGDGSKSRKVLVTREEYEQQTSL
ncbi:MAG TPA: DNA translocase FtsK 4TM domain-containing protein [Acidimicrobiales bacterium]|jgi:S-DNA-T family DNA segregation ATPase FtsK/SpoIIIE|nr:DNA translocase FtsK 4TM domain-containing protein [Acidimicrobiales bacterium]